MAFDQATRNRLQSFVSSARNILSQEFTRQLQADYGMDPKQGTVDDLSTLTHLDNSQRQTAQLLRDTLEHYLTTTPGKSDKERTKQVLERIIREQAFTVLNRLAALRMAEAREFLIESIGKSQSSKGFQLYRQLAGTSHGETGDAYRNYLFSLFDEFSVDLAVLFDRHSNQGRLFPRESALLELLDEINNQEIDELWAEDETIGWIYQYFNSQEERKKMRAESQAPRNSRELAVRNQYFTPRYVVEFLTDNTLGRIWYEMTQGNTRLVDSCSYLVRRPTEVFLKPGEQAPDTEGTEDETLSQEELLQQPVYIPHRKLKDPRSIRMLDPACGSMHFGLYAFDLFEQIYLEAWQLEQELGPDAFQREANQQTLQASFSSLDEFRAQIPKLIIENNIHGIDIDPRAVQIAGLSLWQRAQRSWHQLAIKPQQRPVIVKSNIVCAEPMPGDKGLLQEFTSKLNPPLLGQMLEVIFDKMQLAGEAGTLLKIEEEIATAIEDARCQWHKQSGSNSVIDMFQSELDAATPQQKLGFDLRGIDDAVFWDDAEQLILDALSDYADGAGSTADQKRLFAEDAAKGFAFIDLSRKRFDVLLQNPPFGDSSKSSKSYIKAEYPYASRDILQAFVERLLNLSTENALVGTLSARTGFFMGDSKYWREFVVFKNKINLFVDLGLGVLDDALVEVSAYVIEKNNNTKSSGLVTRHLSTREKEHALEKDISAINNNNLKKSNFTIFDQSLVKDIPDFVFGYWAPRSIIKLYTKLPSFKDAVGSNRVGIQTGDDFRFVRLAWEVNYKNIGRYNRWVRFSKGGEYSPGVDDIHLLLDWKKSGEQISVTKSARFQNSNYMFVPGVSYTVRTASAFSPRILPADTVFSNMSQTWQLAEKPKLLASLAYTLCRVPQAFIELGVGGGDIATAGSAARRYTTAVVEGIPVSDLETLERDVNQEHIKKLLDSKLVSLAYKETSMDYRLPYILQDGEKLIDIAKNVNNKILKAKESALYASYIIDSIVVESFDLDSFEREFVDVEVGLHPCSYEKEPDRDELDTLLSLDEESLINAAVDEYGSKRYFTKKSFFVDRRIEVIAHCLRASPKYIIASMTDKIQDFELKDIARNILSESIGLAFCRWKLTPTLGRLRNPFSALPDISPAGSNQYMEGELTKKDDLMGIFVLEKKSSLDLCSEIFKKITLIKNDGSDALIEDCLSIIGVENIYSYFSNPNFFFADHLSKYSNSRRQAPIYWPLQTPSGTYTLWLYYQTLNGQTLYSCVNNFVEPKLDSIVQDLSTLRSKPARSSQEEKELTRLADLEAELRDFRDELLRIAKFWKPNLNDGVQITAAPLWKLFQHKAWQKKLKDTWEKLEDGDYDWAHLACSIWPERVLRKCHQDRSLAIAHDVEDIFWHEVEVPIKRGAKLTGEMKAEWQPKSLTAAELAELINQTITDLK